MKKIYIVLLFIIVYILTGCTIKKEGWYLYKNLEFNGRRIYYYDWGNSQCNSQILEENTPLFIDETKKWYFDGAKSNNGCESTLFIENEYGHGRTAIIDLSYQKELTKEEFLSIDFDFDLIVADRINIKSEEVIKMEVSFSDESIITDDKSEIKTIVENINDFLGFFDNPDCSSCNYNEKEGFIKLYITEKDFLYFDLTKGGVIHNNKYTVYETKLLMLQLQGIMDKNKK